jgi:hypothetical protein
VASDALLSGLGASHEVSEDFLCRATTRWGPTPDRFWHLHATDAWGDETHPRPLVVLPSHFLRFKARAAHELRENPRVAAVVVVVTVPRPALDQASDWASLASHVDPALLAG